MLKPQLLLTPLVALALAACGQPTALGPASLASSDFGALGKGKDKTVLAMYIGMDDYTGTNTLPEIQEAHRRLAMVGSSAKSDLYLCGDSSEVGDGFRVKVTRNQIWGAGFEQLGELKTNHAPDLRNYLAWVDRSSNQKATHVSISTHGGAYGGILLDHDGKPSVPAASMTLQKAVKALSKGYTGSRIPSLTFDACMMSSIEVGEAIKGTVAVMNGSEDFSMGGSIPWDHVATGLASGKLQDGAAFSRYVTRSVIEKGRWGDRGSRQWSSIALDRDFDRLVASTDKLATALLRAMKTEGPAIRQAAADTRMFAIMAEYKEHYGDFYQRDLVEFCSALAKRVKDPIVKKAAAEVASGVKAVVVAQAKHPSESMANGLAVYLPHGLEPGTAEGRLRAYKKSVFAKHTHWDEFLAALNP